MNEVLEFQVESDKRLIRLVNKYGISLLTLVQVCLLKEVKVLDGIEGIERAIAEFDADKL